MPTITANIPAITLTLYSTQQTQPELLMATETILRTLIESTLQHEVT